MKSFFKNIRIRGDKVIWIILFFLMLFSILEVYSAIGKFAFDKMEGNTTKLLFRHFCFLVFSFFVVLFFSNIKYTYFSPLSKLGYYLSFPLLALTFIIGLTSSKAAGRWIEIPIIGSFQPSEMVKYVVIIYLARMMTLKRTNIKDLATFRNLLIPPLLLGALIFPENFSTSALLIFVAFLLMLIGGVKFKYWVLTGLTGVVLLVGFFVAVSKFDVSIARSGTWNNRIEEYIGKDKEALTQANVAKMAIASGGVVGDLPGSTIQGRLLSESHNDFIYAIIIEELGLLGGVIVLLLYLMLFYRCMRIAFKAEGQFAALTAVGLGLSITIQALVNMGVAVNLLPVTGQTLPFISYGGTSLIFSSVAVGIILNISAEVQKKEEDDTKVDEEQELAEQESEETPKK